MPQLPRSSHKTRLGSAIRSQSSKSWQKHASNISPLQARNRAIGFLAIGDRSYLQMTFLRPSFRRESRLHSELCLQLIHPVFQALYLASQMVAFAFPVDLDNETIWGDTGHICSSTSPAYGMSAVTLWSQKSVHYVVVDPRKCGSTYFLFSSATSLARCRYPLEATPRRSYPISVPVWVCVVGWGRLEHGGKFSVIGCRHFSGWVFGGDGLLMRDEMLMRKSQKWPTLSIRTINLRFNAGKRWISLRFGRIRPLCPALSRMSWLKVIMVLFYTGNNRYLESSWCLDKTLFIWWLNHVKSARSGQIAAPILTSLKKYLNLIRLIWCFFLTMVTF